jgi:hypothetical protein
MHYFVTILIEMVDSVYACSTNQLKVLLLADYLWATPKNVQKKREAVSRIVTRRFSDSERPYLCETHDLAHEHL